MEQIISNGRKKIFLRWLLDRRLLADREIVWLLHYLMNNDHLLTMMHVVDDVPDVGRSMTIACSERCGTGFRYVKTTVQTDDPEKAFHDLRMNQDEDVYLKLDIDAVHRSPIYFSVLEDGPDHAADVHKKFGQMADRIIADAEQAFMIGHLKQSINEALDAGNKEKFNALSQQLKAIRNDRD